MAKAQPFRLEATYTPIAKRSCSRSHKKTAHNKLLVKDGFPRCHLSLIMRLRLGIVSFGSLWSRLARGQHPGDNWRMPTRFPVLAVLSGEPSVVHLLTCVRPDSQQRRLSVRAPSAWSPLQRFAWTVIWLLATLTVCQVICQAIFN